jgi:hypothetical protein
VDEGTGLGSLSCSLGHALQRVVDTESFCDLCAKSGVMTRGTTLRCSRGCDYDLCAGCASFSAELSTLSPRSRTFKMDDAKAWKAKCDRQGVSALVDLLPSSSSSVCDDEDEDEVRSPKLTVAFSQSSDRLMTYRVVGPGRG